MKDTLALVWDRLRIEATANLQLTPSGPPFIPTVSEVQERLAEIVENLHRKELTPLERDMQIDEYANLAMGARLQSPQVAENENSKRADGRGHRRPGGVSQAARDIGIDEDAVRRAHKVASIVPEAKQAARETGIDRSQTALLRVAAAPAEKQVEVVASLADARTNKPPAEKPSRPKSSKWMMRKPSFWFSTRI